MPDEQRPQTAYPLPTGEYELLDLLDRLESLAEDMDELGVRTREQVEQLVTMIHARLDEIDDE